MNATSTNITDTALITDAELADFLSDCTDSHPNTPEHEVTYQEDEQDVAPFDALDIPFALPVHNKMVAVNADGSAIDFSIGYGGAVGSDSAQKSAKQAAKKPSPKSSKKSAKKGAAKSRSDAQSSSPVTTKSTPAAGAGTKRSAPSTSTGASSDELDHDADGGDDGASAPPAQKPRRGSGEPIKYKYPDLNEPGIDEEELKRRKRETRLMKNRESANRSRLRRKKNLEDLEVKNNELHAELDLAREQVRALADALQHLVPRMHEAGVAPAGALPAELQRQLQLLQLGRLFLPNAAPAAAAVAPGAVAASAPALVAAKLSALPTASRSEEVSPSPSPPPSPSASLSSAAASVAGDAVPPGTDGGADSLQQHFHDDVDMMGGADVGGLPLGGGGDDALYFEHDDTVFRSMPLSSNELAGVARARARKQVALATAQRLKQQRLRAMAPASGRTAKAPPTRAAARTYPRYPRGFGRLSQMLFMVVAVMVALVAAVAMVRPQRNCDGEADSLGAAGVLSQFASLAMGDDSQ